MSMPNSRAQFGLNKHNSASNTTTTSSSSSSSTRTDELEKRAQTFRDSEVLKNVREERVGTFTYIIETFMVKSSGESYERLVRVHGQTKPTSTKGRGYTPTSSSGYNTVGSPILDKGHVVALELGGANISQNIVPQFSGLQRHERWREIENLIAASGSVPLEIIVVYPPAEQGTHKRMSLPASFIVKAGGIVFEEVANNPAERDLDKATPRRRPGRGALR